MAVSRQFLMRVPPQMLREHFDQIGLILPEDVDWTATNVRVAQQLLPLLELYDGVPGDQFVTDVERVSAMTDEFGDALIYATTTDREALDRQPTAHARAYDAFLHRRPEFIHAEEARFADERRRGRGWDGFSTRPGLEIQRGETSIQAFRSAVADALQTRRVNVEMCDRGRRRHEQGDAALTQLTIYIEERANDIRTFVDGQLTYLNYRPAREAAVTYEAETGTIEVVASTQEQRDRLARLFAIHILGTDTAGERVDIRRYRLEHLSRRFEFPTDIEDGIKEVVVKSMRVMPFGRQDERMTLELMKGAPRSVWDLAAQRLRDCEAGIQGYAITQATLVVRFRPGAKGGRGRSLPITISAGRSCNLKDCTNQERLIGEKYLRAWGILANV